MSTCPRGGLWRPSGLGGGDCSGSRVRLAPFFFSFLRSSASSLNKRQSPKVWLDLMHPQSSSKLCIVQGPASCSLTMSLLDPPCLLLLEIVKTCSWSSGCSSNRGSVLIPRIVY